ncbi:hypothetical protein MH117_10330 [Paenibacillus sp. ACRRX]|uniref:hypothetical protein n=1 Tax=unclassified Paenibacillus TaxID=185978 RepID=UPI001EF602A6|nr:MULTISPECIES: hypothetical protein [unclassified Paenibacillus]MCG7407819.1 hypothetical protein [Paenibacillus sp. ACRRX]MDK8180962.1 hypothetical protein [Paenibacillus sp. UMB4589-SE434]
MSDNDAALKEAMYAQLQQDMFVLHTTSIVSLGPITNVFAGVYKMGQNTVRVALAGRSRFVSNMINKRAAKKLDEQVHAYTKKA